VKVAYSSGTSLQVRQWTSGNHPRALGIPYGVLNTGAAAKNGAHPIIALKYDDNAIPWIGSPPVSSATVSEAINTGTTPDEIGAVFTVPFSCKVKGAIMRLSGAATTFAMKLYDDADGLLESVTGIDVEQGGATAGVGGYMGLFDTEVTLTAGATYRLTCLPEDTTNITVYRGIVDASATREAWPGGTAWQKTSRTDAGAWSPTDTQVPLMSLLISALDDGASGGGGGASTWWGA
jgi:hypothetical protein